MGTRVQFEGEEFKVTEMNVLARRVRFQSESGASSTSASIHCRATPPTQAWEMRVRAGGAGRGRTHEAPEHPARTEGTR